MAPPRVSPASLKGAVLLLKLLASTFICLQSDQTAPPPDRPSLLSKALLVIVSTLQRDMYIAPPPWIALL